MMMSCDVIIIGSHVKGKWDRELANSCRTLITTKFPVDFSNYEKEPWKNRLVFDYSVVSEELKYVEMNVNKYIASNILTLLKIVNNTCVFYTKLCEQKMKWIICKCGI